MKNSLVVLGMHRSGTSAFTSIFAQPDGNTGSRVSKPQAGNAKVSVDTEFVVSTNDCVLETLGSSWDGTLPLPEDWLDTLVGSQLPGLIHAFLRSEIKDGELFVFSDPRLSKLLPLWLPVFSQESITPHFVVLVRNPLEIAYSLKRRKGFSIEKSLLLWMQYMIEAERSTRGQARCLVTFESLLNHPKATVQSAFHAIGLPMPHVSLSRSKELTDVFDAKRLSQQGSNLDSQCPTPIAEFYRVLCKISERENSSEKDIQRLDELSQDFIRYQSLFYNKDAMDRQASNERKFQPDWYRSELHNIKRQFETDKVYREYRYLANTDFLYKDRSALQVKVQRLEALLAQSSSHPQSPRHTRYRQSLERWLPQGSLRQRIYQNGKQILIGASAVRKDTLALPVQTAVIDDPLGLSANQPDLDRNEVQETVPAQKSLAFSVVEHPQVSIVIPVFSSSQSAERCLQSVYQHTSGSYEIIVVDNKSTGVIPEYLASSQGIQVITNSGNAAYPTALNRAAKDARGEFILLLSGDTEVGPGWLEALLAPFEDPATGVVGAKHVHPDGTLQEAGGIVWRDGMPCGYGRGDNPDRPQYCYRRSVDYCSGTCLIISRRLWDEIGGLDERYAPDCYVDIDLCFSVRAMGHKVIYQPNAVVTHHAGALVECAINPGYTGRQEVDRQKFVDKWQTELALEHYPVAEKPVNARERSRGKHILVIDGDVPTFDKDSGSVRMFSMLQILLDMGYRVSFWPDQLSYKPRYTRALQDIGVETCYGEMDFEQFIAERGDGISAVIMSRPATAIKYVQLVKKHSRAQTIFDTVDLHFVREQRRLEQEVQHWKNMEFYLAEETDRTLVVSPTEKLLLSAESFADKVAVVSNIHALEECKTSFEERRGIMFIGGFRHPPNEEGVVWFIDYILPLIRKQLPDVHLTVVGSDPTDRLLSLANDTVTVTGYVEDVSTYFNDNRVFVCPLLHGAGVKGKIGQSLSYGLPVVTTSIGAEGMELQDGHSALITDSEKTFADKVVQLYNDSFLWQKLSANGRQVIKDHFSANTVRAALHAVLEDTT